MPSHNHFMPPAVRTLRSIAPAAGSLCFHLVRPVVQLSVVMSVPWQHRLTAVGAALAVVQYTDLHWL